jgi:predicted transport protein
MSFKSNKYLQQHLKCKRHTEQVTKQATTSKYQCKACGKKYSMRQSLHAHKKVCVGQISPNQQNETQETETISKKDHKNQMEELKLAFEKEINKLQKEMQKEIQKINIRLEKTDIKTKSRKKINKDTRQSIADKQENACGECKITLSPYFELDHIIGLQFGGTDEESNLMALCRECHGKKSIRENQCRKRIQDAIQTILQEQKT